MTKFIDVTYFFALLKRVLTRIFAVASVGWTSSQKMWLLLLGQYVEIGIQGPSAYNLPIPQQADLTSRKSEKIETYL